jgi:hypothetical protein
MEKQFNRVIAWEYFTAYARFEKVRLDEGIKVNSFDKIRGKVGAAEFEYDEKTNIFIVRGLIDKNIFEGDIRFKTMLIERILALNKTYKSEMPGARFEWDTTAYELKKDYPERLNLRVDFIEPIETKEFVKKVDKFMDEAYVFKKTEFMKIFDEVNRTIFPSKTIPKE